MTTAVIIPCRYASTRFAGKPLVVFEGRPIIAHVCQRVARAAGVDLVAVATDDQRIARAVKDFGGQVIMTDAACRSGTDRVAEAADRLNLKDGDIVVNVQGDQPAVAPESLTAVIAPLTADPAVEMTTLAFPIADPAEIFHPKDVKVVFDQQGDAIYFSRAPIPFARDGAWRFEARDGDCALHFNGAAGFVAFKHLGVYAFRKSFLDTYRRLPPGRLEEMEKLEQLRVLEHGFRIRVVVTEHDSPEIDCPEDLERLQRHRLKES
ncbi:MAG TPA: 3-deoxy-manno-octulosonate cytidylyltransferase [Desulfobacteraceae bacterium]|nr:3-deoxy-manno-octulosonate cytidylyltransferase [Deltaproteobacteria bacterium]MBW2356387.1 3-deoxy-manno-octulosonate cytidylyltransferase [Deltaproteobacteria bacterium]HDI59850.1 3-deoxy-manno-octulosonate cytidylyltransferase [Desulfobacteraceae bacterium]